MRGGNWEVWAYGLTDGFNPSALCDGIIVRDASDELVWVLAVGLLDAPQPQLLCPCQSSFVNTSATEASFNVIGSRWTCDQAAARGSSWVRLFDASSALLCAPNAVASSGDRL